MFRTALVSRFAGRFAINRFARRALVALVAIAAFAPVARAAADYVLTGRAEANAIVTRTLYVGASDRYVVLLGDHATEMDCWLFDEAGTLISRDLRDGDVCVLPAPGIGIHRIVIKNWGTVYNEYKVATTPGL